MAYGKYMRGHMYGEMKGGIVGLGFLLTLKIKCHRSHNDPNASFVFVWYKNKMPWITV